MSVYEGLSCLQSYSIDRTCQTFESFQHYWHEGHGNRKFQMNGVVNKGAKLWCRDTNFHFQINNALFKIAERYIYIYISLNPGLIISIANHFNQHHLFSQRNWYPLNFYLQLANYTVSSFSLKCNICLNISFATFDILLYFHFKSIHENKQLHSISKDRVLRWLKHIPLRWTNIIYHQTTRKHTSNMFSSSKLQQHLT